jgi:hypothetical protein
MENGPQWWGVYLFGGVLFIAVVMAEFISVDSDDPRIGLASVILVAVSFGLFFFMVTALRASGQRLYIIALLIMPVSAIISQRLVNLRVKTSWKNPWFLVLGLVSAELAVGLHYLPLSVLTYGLLISGLVFALSSLTGNLLDDQQVLHKWIEPTVILCSSTFLAILFSI